MSLAADLFSNAAAFIKAATNFVGIIEKNVDSLLRLKKKYRVAKQLAAVEGVLRMFPQIMFFNGVFITEFDKQYVMSVKHSDDWARTRDGRVINEFASLLDEIEQNFNEDARRIQGLGSEMISLFKQGIALRRKILEDYHSGALKFNKATARKVREEFGALRPVERRLYEIRTKLEKELTSKVP